MVKHQIHEYHEGDNAVILLPSNITITNNYKGRDNIPNRKQCNKDFRATNQNMLRLSYTNLIKPMARETSHNFQLRRTVEVNFPRKKIMITWRIHMKSKDDKAS